MKSDDDSDAAARKRKERVILASKDITLSRIAASFPHITLSVAKHAGIQGKANLIAIKEQFKLNEKKHDVQMPAVLQHGLIPALIPKADDSKYGALRDFCYMFNLEQTVTLQHPSVKKSMIMEPIQTHIDNSIKYVSAAVNGPLTDDTTRVLLLDAIINIEDDKINPWIKAGQDAWRKSQNVFNYSSLVTSLTQEGITAGSMLVVASPVE